MKELLMERVKLDRERESEDEELPGCTGCARILLPCSSTFLSGSIFLAGN